MAAKKKPELPELLNTSELARRSGLNRATVRERLEQAGIEPKEQRAKEKRYDVDEALAVLQGADDEIDLKRAQTLKTTADAARSKLKYERERGAVVPVTEVRAELQEIISRIFKHFAVHSPQKLAPALRKAKTTGDIALALKRDAEAFFEELRTEHESYL